MSLLQEDNLLANVWHVDVALDYESCTRVSEGQINEREQCAEGQLANANNLIEIVLQALVWSRKQLHYTNKLYAEQKP